MTVPKCAFTECRTPAINVLAGAGAMYLCQRHSAMRWAILSARRYRIEAAACWDFDEAARMRSLAAEYEDEVDSLAAGGNGGYAWLNGRSISEGERPTRTERLGRLILRLAS